MGMASQVTKALGTQGSADKRSRTHGCQQPPQTTGEEDRRLRDHRGAAAAGARTPLGPCGVGLRWERAADPADGSGHVPPTRGAARTAETAEQLQEASAMCWRYRRRTSPSALGVAADTTARRHGNGSPTVAALRDCPLVSLRPCVPSRVGVRSRVFMVVERLGPGPVSGNGLRDHGDHSDSVVGGVTFVAFVRRPNHPTNAHRERFPTNDLSARPPTPPAAAPVLDHDSLGTPGLSTARYALERTPDTARDPSSRQLPAFAECRDPLTGHRRGPGWCVGPQHCALAEKLVVVATGESCGLL